MARNKYTVDYFINKFKAIPLSRWHVGELINADGTKKCALGHCGVMPGRRRYTREALQLSNLFLKFDAHTVAGVNDGFLSSYYRQKTPKGRILACLKGIKKLQGANK